MRQCVLFGDGTDFGWGGARTAKYATQERRNQILTAKNAENAEVNREMRESGPDGAQGRELRGCGVSSSTNCGVIMPGGITPYEWLRLVGDDTAAVR